MTTPIPVTLHERLLACLCAALADTANATPVAGYGPVHPEWCCWTMGTDPLPAQKCCVSDGGNGMAWVRTVGWTPITDDACDNDAFNQTIELGVHRCAPKQQDAETPVPCDVRTMHAKRMQIDARAIRRAVLCCDALDLDVDGDRQWQPLTMAPLATQGGCSSWIYQISVRDYDNCVSL